MLTKESSVFGVRLEEVMSLSHERMRLSPKIVGECVQVLTTQGMKFNDIFLKSPNPETLINIRTALDRCENFTFEDDEEHVHIAAHILLSWIRELPEPLIPPSLYDTIISCSGLSFFRSFFTFLFVFLARTCLIDLSF